MAAGVAKSALSVSGPTEDFLEVTWGLRWQNVRDGALHVLFGKTNNARGSVPLTALLEMRRARNRGDWVFPASTRSGHMEKSTLKKQHRKALTLAKVEAFKFYTLRHACLTRWSAHMDPDTLAYSQDPVISQLRGGTSTRRRTRSEWQWTGSMVQ